MIALMCWTVQFSPSHAETLIVVPAKACTVGCSLTLKSGISQLTAGSDPLGRVGRRSCSTADDPVLPTAVPSGCAESR